jgi:cell wall-associated NlpC family hydrolase
MVFAAAGTAGSRTGSFTSPSLPSSSLRRTMAAPITIPEIQARDITQYANIRSTLRTGDLVFCSGTYFFSKAIRWFTKSVWSHVGIIYHDENLGRVFILESETFIGVRLAPLSKYLRDYHGKDKPYRGSMIIARLKPDPDAQDIKKAISFGMDELTKPYDNWEILRIALRILFKSGRRSRDKKYICSELVYEAFRKAGIWFKFNRKSISPDDIWKDERVDSVCRIL